MFGNSDERLVTDKLRKIIWFTTSTEWFNYLLVKGTKIHSNLDEEDIMILYWLFNIAREELNLNVEWLSRPDIFALNVKWAIKWAGDQKNNLIFKYKPSEEVQKAYQNFIRASLDYKFSIDTEDNKEKYEKMVLEFKKLFNII